RLVRDRRARVGCAAPFPRARRPRPRLRPRDRRLDRHGTGARRRHREQPGARDRAGAALMKERPWRATPPNPGCQRRGRPGLAASMRPRMLALARVPLTAGSVAAAPPDVADVVSKMKETLEPPKASLRQLKLSISGEDGGTTQWTLAQARKKIDGKGRMLTVLLSPKEERGVASLLIDGDKQTKPEGALYIPTIRRVRTLTPAGAYEPVLGSDFFYADLGFISLRDKFRLIGSEKHAGKDAVKIEETPESPWYYSKIVSWIDPTTSLPLERDYY